MATYYFNFKKELYIENNLSRIISKVQQYNKTNLTANKSFQKLRNFYYPSEVS